MRVPRGIQHRLVADTQQLMFDVGGVALRHAADAEFEIDRLIGGGAGGAVAQRFDQIAGFERR